jgi:hypothetical protein
MSQQEAQGQVGPAGALADGAKATLRQGREVQLIASDLSGKYYESASRQQTFIACTAAAGIAPGTVLTATGALMLANPVGSGYNLEILRARMAWVSGTFGAGTVWWVQGANPAALPAETAAAQRVSTFLNGTNSGDVAKAYSGVSLTTVPTIVRPTGWALAVYAGTGAVLNPPLDEPVEGELVVPPGFFVALEAIAAAGTSPIVNLSITYALRRP